MAREPVEWYSAGGGGGGGLSNVALVAEDSADAPRGEAAKRQIIRAGTLHIVAANLEETAEQIRSLTTRLDGLVVTSSISGEQGKARRAEVSVRIPAQRFDEARQEIRKLARYVERDTVEARDVTKEYVDLEATLRNYRAEEAQYLQILKRAVKVQDVLDVTEKLNEVRRNIETTEGEIKYLSHQVEMSAITIIITAEAEAQVMGIRWRPLYEMKVAVRTAALGLAEWVNLVIAFLLHIPLILLWALTIFVIAKLGWRLLRILIRIFFPNFAARRQAEPQAT